MFNFKQNLSNMFDFKNMDRALPQPSYSPMMGQSNPMGSGGGLGNYGMLGMKANAEIQKDQWKNTLSDSATAASTARESLAAAQQMYALAPQFESGKMATFKNEALGWAGLPDPEYERAKALTNAMALAQKKPGSGTMSDRDLLVFQSVVPNVQDSQEALQMKAKMFEAYSKRAIDQEMFFNHMSGANVSVAEAKQEWQRYVNSVALFDDKATPLDAPSYEEWVQQGRLEPQHADIPQNAVDAVMPNDLSSLSSDQLLQLLNGE